MTTIQRDLHADLATRAEVVRQRIEKAARPLDGARLMEHPEPTGWSAGQVLEHLCVSDELYDEVISRLLSASRPDAGAPLREWSPTLLGRLIAGSLSSTRKFKAPRAFQPGPTPRAGVLEKLIARELRFREVMDSAASMDWRKLRFKPPTLPLPVKINMGDAFVIHVTHLERHAAQLERVVGKLSA